MDMVIRGAVVYLFLFIVMRAAGNRQFSQLTAFDAVLLIIVAEATQQALLGEDFSVTGGLILIMTLVGIDIVLSLAKHASRTLDTAIEGVPVLLMDEGKPLEESLKRERVDEEDILVAARERQGLESLEQVKYAILERDGNISIVPW